MTDSCAEALQFETDDQEGTGMEDEELADDPVMQIDLTVSSHTVNGTVS